jgi:glycerol-3-phosphate acyltransferase PlsX
LARIALDAMGGDHAPRAAIAGALLALAELPAGHTIQLVGQPQVIAAELDALAAPQLQRERIEVIAAPEVIGMTDKPSVALRSKASSMVVGLELQPRGLSDGFVSAGNTGAQMAASMRILKLMPGLERPAIGTLFPTALKPVLVLDSGANVDCSAEELLQFARLGSVYAEDLLGRANPVIGLLSVGEEDEKGNAVVKEANALLRASGLNFQGNVEGRDIPQGQSERGPIDVVVCDGFVGNILLKFYEAAGPVIMRMMVERLGLDASKVRKGFSEFDYTEQGGAPLLGVSGVSIISHGKSNDRAIKNAIRVALRAVESGMTEHASRRLSQSVSA